MLEISNIEVSGLRSAIVSCRNAMRVDMADLSSSDEFEKGLVRARRLVRASCLGSGGARCHDNFLTGIVVCFDMKYTQYITKQMQRYHWFQYVSSSSLMHRITQMDFGKCVNEWVSDNVVEHMKGLVAEYNRFVAAGVSEHVFVRRGGDVVVAKTHGDVLYCQFMRIISDCPMGTELFVHVVTNYKQLQTMYNQRRHHKLREDWGAFCRFVEQLPYAKDLIICDIEK